MKPETLERAMSATLTVAAVVIAAALVHDELASKRALAARGATSPPEVVAHWSDVVRAGVLIGDSAAPVKVVEFGDFECPFCRRFEMTYRSVKARFGRSVALVFVSYPLTNVHRFAAPADRAASCALAQGQCQSICRE